MDGEDPGGRALGHLRARIGCVVQRNGVVAGSSFRVEISAVIGGKSAESTIFC